MKAEILKIVSLLVMLGIVGGCVTGPVDNDAGNTTVTSLGNVEASWAEVSDTWWRVFGDDTLDSLIETAMADNTSLRAAWRRVEEAGYASRAVSAGGLPQVTLSGAAGRVRRQAPVGGGISGESQWGVSVAASYELDVWRRLSASVSQAEALRDASARDHEALAISLAATICEAWFDVNEQMQLLELLDAQLTANSANLLSIERRYRRGLASLLDVYQQRELVAGIHSQLPRAEALVEVACNRLAVLVGLLPGEGFVRGVGALPALPSPIDGDIDAYVVENRPDVRAAFMRLSAAEQAAAAANRDRLPVVRLTAGAGSAGGDPSDLLDEWTGEVLVGVQLPLTDGGRRRADVARQQAVARERLELYAETVRQAMREVYDARILEAKQAETVVQLGRELEAARNTLEQSEDRYRNGLVDYLSVLSAQTRVQQLERNTVSARRRQLSYRVQFCRAIAGNGPARNEELK